MSTWSYILAGLRQFWRIHLSVAAGVAIAGAVITGALLVGDSMRGSLRELALEGLGRIDVIVTAEHPFRTELAEEWLTAEDVSPPYADAVALLLTQGNATYRSGETQRRATNLSVAGVPKEFWSLAIDFAAISSNQARDPAATRELSGNRVAVSRNVAEELQVQVGDTLLLRIPVAGSVPADSTLGEKDDVSASRRLEVAAVLEERDRGSFARFSLRPNQQAPRNVFVSLSTLQSIVDQPGQANAIALAVDAGRATNPAPAAAREAAVASLQPALVDFGIAVDQLPPLGNQGERIQISADRLVLSPHVVETAEQLFGADQLQSAVTYLANTIEAGGGKIPYSTVVGVESTAQMGPLLDEHVQPIKLADDEVALNSWAAEDLGVQLGDDVAITFYEPETTHGELRKHAPLSLKLAHIAPLENAEGQPTLAADPAYAPVLPGVTDQRSIREWDLPFELVEEVRRQDEDYWEERRTTPKAFISLDLAKRLWQTRWGTISVMRLPADETQSAQSVAAQLQAALEPSELGMRPIAVKQEALDAASGTTPFDGLFLGFSFFLMASAVMLVALLFRLGVEQRAREVGLLRAAGVSAKRVGRLFSVEAAVVAIGGAAVGVAAGVGYARLMVYGLNHWWVEATAAPFLTLHTTSRSLLIGFAAAILAAMLTILWTLRQLAKLPERQLLAGDAQPPIAARPASRAARIYVPLVCIAGAALLGLVAWRWEGEAQAGAFFGGGTLMLLGLLAMVRAKLVEGVSASPRKLRLQGLALRNARRNPGRTLLSLALAATASFLIVALSAFRLAPTERGVGGFDLMATSDLPLLYDLNTVAGRAALGMNPDSDRDLEAVTTVGFRVHEGQDASCLNLYQPTQPTVLGAPPLLGETASFAWAAQADFTEGGRPVEQWDLLQTDLGVDSKGRPIVPMVLDRNTAYYSLKKYRVGDRLEIRDGLDQPRMLQIVGMLANSVLQGQVIVSDAQFEGLFPNTSGRRFFLIKRTPGAPAVEQIASDLETELPDFGFDAVETRVRLGQYLAVQNTYLSTFQSLGALGLLLGAVGLAVVQLRSVLERRGELALMRAAGFRNRRLARLVLSENLVLLLGGLAIGCVAALAAVVPHAAAQQANTPWGTLAGLLGIVAMVGALAGWLAVRSALAAPLLPALRGD